MEIFSVPRFILPPPRAVFEAALTNFDSLYRNGKITVLEASLGFSFALVLGSLLAVIFTYSTKARDVVLPIIVAFEGVPKLALAPVITVWLGTGLISKIALSALLAFFPIVINVSRGFMSVPQEVVLYAQSLCAPEWRVFFFIRVWYSIPWYLDAAKIALPAALVGAIVGEFISSQGGLGFMLLLSLGNLNMELAFAVIGVLALISLTGYMSISQVERRFAASLTISGKSDGRP